jgi:hypothetical protein
MRCGWMAAGVVMVVATAACGRSQDEEVREDAVRPRTEATGMQHISQVPFAMMLAAGDE